jgi:lysophospholipase L1-like esterase
MTGRTSRRARLVLLLAAPVLLVATASCSSEHESAAIAPYGTDSTVPVAPTVAAGTAAPTDVIAVRRLAMVGDSITQGAQQQLEEAFDGLRLDDVVINAEQGRRMTAANSITSGVEGIEDVLKKGPPPDLWVIALGTNDVANYQPPDYAPAIEQVLAAIPAGAPVLWIDCYLDKYPDQSQQFDTTLRQVLAARGHSRVVDWATVASEDGVLRDGIHPSGFGIDEFTRRVSTAVADWTS